MSGPRTIVGVDIGGTFTDFALVDPDSGALFIGKQLTTPDDPSRALLEGIDALCRRAGVSCATLDRICHATTLVTNAIIERKGARTGLLVTEGFRDVLVMGRESRYDHFDLAFERPQPLVPRSLTREVSERLAWNDEVVVPLDLAQVRAAVRELADAGVTALAVCLVHAYRNPAHEQAIRQLIEAEFPAIDCTISSEVAPEIREYERASTAVSNAYIRPLVREYLASLDRKLAARGFRKQVQVMLSNGGISSTEVAQRLPIQLIESGPAAGALAASLYARLLGIGRALAFDMGGTTAKLCCIEHGQPYHANVFEAARARRFRRGSGLPLMIPVIELIEVGAGGGSIARIDNLGLLKVGPHSAGAQPGPAAYGRGGTEPTVTDADIALGFIDPTRFLGGDMLLDRDAALRAIDTRVAQPLERSTIEAAWGIFNVVNETMVAAGKRYAAEKALDLRGFTLITFGGAAPIHAWQVARILGVARVVYPLGAGATSAVGLCVAAPVVNLSNSFPGRLDQLDFGNIAAMFAGMEQRALAMLASAGAQPATIGTSCSVTMRYSGQGYEIEVDISGIDLAGKASAVVREIHERFEQAYLRHYAAIPDAGVPESVTWRLKASGQAVSLDLKPGADAAGSSAAPRASRRVYFGPGTGFVDCPVHDRYRLVPGSSGTGPGLFEERETTVVVAPGARWSVDAFLNLSVEL